MKNELKKIDIGYKRIQNKIKDLRQGYSKAVLVGRRSGSGQLVCEFYDELTLIWAGAPNTQPLPMGISSSQISTPDDVDREEDINNDVTLTELYVDLDSVSTPQSKTDSNSFTNIVPTLIDDKRKYLQRTLPAAQRNSLLLEEAKEEKRFRVELEESINDSNKCLAELCKCLTSAKTMFASSIEKIANTVTAQPNIQFPSPHHYYGNHQQFMPRMFPYTRPWSGS